LKLESPKKVLVFHRNDNVAVALTDLKRGQEVEVEVNGEKLKITLLNDIPFGHKFAIRDIPEGREVIKYGEVIGISSKFIKTGEHVHVHNVKSVKV
jgi:altronate dehydratase small subunit